MAWFSLTPSAIRNNQANADSATEEMTITTTINQPKLCHSLTQRMRSYAGNRNKTSIKVDHWHVIDDRLATLTSTSGRCLDEVERVKNPFNPQIEAMDSPAALPPHCLSHVVHFLLPLRHLEIAAHLNNLFISVNSNSIVTQSTFLTESGNRLLNAQLLSELATCLGGNSESLALKSDAYWVQNPVWKDVHTYIEATLSSTDWFETFIAQHIVFDSLINDLYYRQLNHWLQEQCKEAAELLIPAVIRPTDESQTWSDTLLKSVNDESDHNRSLIQSWVSHWRIQAQQSLALFSDQLLNDGALANAFCHLEQRLNNLEIH